MKAILIPIISIFFSLLFFLTGNQLLFAQNGFQNLFFNSQSDIVKLNFSGDSPIASQTGIIGAYEGIAHFEDEAGNPIFYFNGNGVYNQNKIFMPGSIGILANGSSAEVAICPDPSSPDRFYILYNAETCSNLYYSIIDMNLNGGLGDVTNLNTLIDNGNFSEGMEIISIPETNDFWFFTYQCGFGFTSFLIDENGVGEGTIIHEYSMPPGGYDGRGETDYHNGKIGACFAWSSAVFTAEFDPISGNICNPITLSDSVFSNSAFGVDFSPSGSKMYFSLWYTLGQNNVFQYDFETNTYQGFNPPLGGSVSNGLGEIELGLDGKLYIIEDGGTNILVIDNPDDDIPIFSTISIDSNTGLGISDQIQSFTSPQSNNMIETVCVEEFADYTIYTPNPDEIYDWYNQLNPSVLLATNSSLTISATSLVQTYIGYNIDNSGCTSSTYQITINPKPVLFAGFDQAINSGESIMLQANAAEDLTVLWAGPNIDNPYILNPTVSPSETTTYTISVSNYLCTSIDEVTIYVDETIGIEDDPASAEAQIRNVMPEGLLIEAEKLKGIFQNLNASLEALSFRSFNFQLCDLLGRTCYSSSNSSPININGLGNEMNSGTYIWTINAKETSGKTFDLSGQITLF